MLSYERDYFLYRILGEYSIYEHKNAKLKVICPPLDIIYEANYIYKKTYEECKNNNTLDEKQLRNLLIDVKEWNEEDEKILDELIPQKLEDMKVEMFQNYLNKEKCKKIKKYMDRVEQEQRKLYSKRHHYDYLTCEGAATFAKMLFIIENTTFLNKQLYEFDKIHEHEVLEFMYSEYISEPVLREIVRHDPWNSMWKTSKKNTLFDKSSIEVSEDKRRLVGWSMLYDSIYEFQDCPTDEVIKNDDCLDGFLIIKRREIEKQKKQNYMEKKLGRNAQAPEVFVITKSEEERKEIYEMNDPHARTIINERLKYIEKHGEVLEKDLPDVKREVMMEMNRKAMSRGKGQ